MLENIQNYGPYAELIKTRKLKISTSEITKDNIDNHFIWILNMFRDGIETDIVQKSFVEIEFDDKVSVELSLSDLLMNIIMWDMIVKSDTKLTPKHLFVEPAITKRNIKQYIDRNFIEPKRTSIPNMKLNNMIDDMMYKYGYIDEFSGYLANTINLEDFIELMNKHPEFDQLLHSDLSNVPLEDVKHKGQEAANKMIDYIKNSDHCLADFFRAGEGVNPKQFKEVAANIGTKPDGRGGVYPTVINTNFLTGGVNDLVSFFIESSTGRVAQIIVEGNVGISGYFARLLGLNNLDTIIYPDPNYVCDSKNFIEMELKSEEILKRLNNRYYRFSPTGMEYKLEYTDTHLIGKKIYLRSPMTCASHSRGDGICYKCYGDLAYTNNDINIGKIAAEEISSKLTQRMLSAKHLLESAIKEMKWTKAFEQFFDIDYDVIKVIDDDAINLKGYRLCISKENIHLQNDYDNIEYNEFVDMFEIISPSGESFDIYTEDVDKMYITSELNTFIRENAEENEGKLSLNLIDLVNIPLFIVEIQNNELSASLNEIKSVINNTVITKSLNKDELIQRLINTFINGGLDVTSIHGEVILSNQLRNVDNILEMPQWEYPNEPYQVLTLGQALSNNPSVIISLSYEGISRMLFNPLTYRKDKPSFMDLFFMENPSLYLDNSKIEKTKDDGYIEKDKKQIISFVEESTSDNDDLCEENK